MHLDWKQLSIGYIFHIILNQSFVNGLENQIHPETKTYYNYILSAIQKYQTFPTAQHMREQFNLHAEHSALSHLPIGELQDRLKFEKVKYDAQVAIIEIQKALTTDGSVAQDFIKPLMEFQNNVFNVEQNEIIWYSRFAEVMQYYREHNGEHVCYFGSPLLDRYTNGLSAGDFIVLYANTGQGKSTMTRWFAGNMAKQGKRVLYITLEESARKSVLKTIGTQIQTNFHGLINGDYPICAYDKLCNFHTTGDIAFVDRLESGSIAEISKYVHQVRPDVVMIDQIPHLIHDHRFALHEAVTRKSNELRQYFQNVKIPCVALTQANKAGLKSNVTLEESMGYAYSQARDASIILFLHPDMEAGSNIMKRGTILKNRDFQSGQSIDWRWDIGNGVIEEQNISVEYYSGGSTYVSPNISSTQPETTNTDGTAMGGGQTGGTGLQQHSY